MLRSRRFALFALVIMVVAAVGQVGLVVRDASRHSTPRSGAVFIPAGDRADVRFPAASLLSGGQFDRSAINGHVTVVNFWASWCAPCYREAPTLQALATQRGGLGVMFVGVDSQETTTGAGQIFVDKAGIAYPNIFDGDGAVQLAFSHAVQLNALPVTVVLDSDGRVGGVVYGEASYTALDGLSQQVSGQL